MDKNSLRKMLQAQRLAMAPDEVRHKSEAIVDRAIAVTDWASVKQIHCFLGIASLNEPDTTGVFEFIQENYPEINTYTTQKIDGQWYHGVLGDGKFKSVDSVPKLDIVFVPLLGFDVANNRLGHGNGFYDRFLATQPQAKKIGLAFEISRVDALPAEPHDVPLDMVITEVHKQ